jgi:hypothetical protein
VVLATKEKAFMMRSHLSPFRCKRTSFLARLHRVHYGLLTLRFRIAGIELLCTSTGEHAGNRRVA